MCQELLNEQLTEFHLDTTERYRKVYKNAKKSFYALDNFSFELASGFDFHRVKTFNMIFQIFLVAVCTATLAYGNLHELDVEEMAAVQERLARYEVVEEMFRSILNPEEKREEKCLPEGAECKFGSGPNCCGIATRCIVWDTQLTANRRGGPARWLSKCRKYKLGVAMEWVGNQFS